MGMTSFRQVFVWEPGPAVDWSQQITLNEWRSFNRARLEDYVLTALLASIFLMGSALSTWSLILLLWCWGHFQLSGRKWVGRRAWSLWHHRATLATVAIVTIAAVAESRSSFAILSYAWFALPLWYSWEEDKFRLVIESASQTPTPAVPQ